MINITYDHNITLYYSDLFRLTGKTGNQSKKVTFIDFQLLVTFQTVTDPKESVGTKGLTRFSRQGNIFRNQMVFFWSRSFMINFYYGNNSKTVKKQSHVHYIFLRCAQMYEAVDFVHYISEGPIIMNNFYSCT